MWNCNYCCWFDKLLQYCCSRMYVHLRTGIMVWYISWNKQGLGSPNKLIKQDNNNK